MTVKRTVRLTTLPPLEYDTPFTGKLTIWRVNSIDDIETKYCVGSNTHFACATQPVKPPLAHCVIWLVKDEVLKSMGLEINLALRHELAHCNGWSKEHKGGKWVPFDTKVKVDLPPNTAWLRAAPPVVCLTPEGKEESCKSREPVLPAEGNPWASILQQQTPVDCARRFAGWHFCAKED